MAITSSSTQAEIVGQYLDNLTYDIDNDSAKAASFIAACRALLVMHPSDWQASRQRITYDPRTWTDQLERAQSWYAARQSSSGVGSVHHMSFQSFRD